jgi:hypothetical protein
MSDWSSYKDQQFLAERWRDYLGNWRGEDEPSGDEEESTEDDPTQDTDVTSFGKIILPLAQAANLVPGGQIVSTPANIISFFDNINNKQYGEALLDLVGLMPVLGGALKLDKANKTVRAALTLAKEAEQARSVVMAKKAFEDLFEQLFGADNSTKVVESLKDGIRKASEADLLDSEAKAALELYLPSTSSLSETLQENKQLNHWKLLAGIK